MTTIPLPCFSKDFELETYSPIKEVILYQKYFYNEGLLDNYESFVDYLVENDMVEEGVEIEAELFYYNAEINMDYLLSKIPENAKDTTNIHLNQDRDREYICFSLIAKVPNNLEAWEIKNKEYMEKKEIYKKESAEYEKWQLEQEEKRLQEQLLKIQEKKTNKFKE